MTKERQVWKRTSFLGEKKMHFPRRDKGIIPREWAMLFGHRIWTDMPESETTEVTLQTVAGKLAWQFAGAGAVASICFHQKRQISRPPQFQAFNQEVRLLELMVAAAGAPFLLEFRAACGFGHRADGLADQMESARLLCSLQTRGGRLLQALKAGSGTHDKAT